MRNKGDETSLINMKKSSFTTTPNSYVTMLVLLRQHNRSSSETCELFVTEI